MDVSPWESAQRALHGEKSPFFAVSRRGEHDGPTLALRSVETTLLIYIRGTIYAVARPQLLARDVKNAVSAVSNKARFARRPDEKLAPNEAA
jgi:hypothetical protein